MHGSFHSSAFRVAPSLRQCRPALRTRTRRRQLVKLVLGWAQRFQTNQRLEIPRSGDRPLSRRFSAVICPGSRNVTFWQFAVPLLRRCLGTPDGFAAHAFGLRGDLPSFADCARQPMATLTTRTLLRIRPEHITLGRLFLSMALRKSGVFPRYSRRWCSRLGASGCTRACGGYSSNIPARFYGPSSRLPARFASRCAT